VTTASDAERVSVCLFWAHPLVLAEFQRVLPEEAFELAEERIAADVRGTTAASARNPTDVSVLDSDVRGAAPEELARLILGFRPGTRLAVLGERFDEDLAFRLLREGAKGLLTYADVPNLLPLALSEIARGGFWVSRPLLARFVDTALRGAAYRRLPPRDGLLTAREREVYEDLLANLSNKEIARKRYMSARTAQFHVSNVLAKLGVKRRADLLLQAFRA
jgi:DNA-binding NarL/FixJ family response regulator